MANNIQYNIRFIERLFWKFTCNVCTKVNLFNDAYNFTNFYILSWCFKLRFLHMFFSFFSLFNIFSRLAKVQLLCLFKKEKLKCKSYKYINFNQSTPFITKPRKQNLEGHKSIFIYGIRYAKKLVFDKIVLDNCYISVMREKKD